MHRVLLEGNEDQAITSSMPPKLAHISRARNRDIYLRFYTKTLFLEGIGLDKGVHVSISSISDPKMSSSASESTLFCAPSRAPSNADLFVTYTFQLQRSCTSRNALRYLRCGHVLSKPRMTSDDFRKHFLAENSRSLIHRLMTCWLNDDVLVKKFHLAMAGPVVISLPRCERPGFITLIPKCD